MNALSLFVAVLPSATLILQQPIEAFGFAVPPFSAPLCGCSTIGRRLREIRKWRLEPHHSYASYLRASEDDDEVETETETESNASAGKYELGVGKNAPLHLRKDLGSNATSSTEPSVEEIAKNWALPTPVKKPPSKAVVPKKYDLGMGKNRPIGSIDGNGSNQNEVRKRTLLPKDEEGKFLSRAVWHEGHYTDGDGGSSNDSISGSGLVGAHVDGSGPPIRMPKKVEKPEGNVDADTQDAGTSHLDDDAVEAAASAYVATLLGAEDGVISDDVAEGPVSAQPLESTPAVKFEDIDLSVPLSVYDPQGHGKDTGTDLVWELMRHEARVEAEREPILVSFLHSTILNHQSLESALAFHLANKLSAPAMIGTQIMTLIREALDSSPDFRTSLRADMLAVRDRDPACTCLPDVFLYFKGFHALQTHRVAHYLWTSGRHVLSHYLQSQVSQNFQIDIHPNATLGSGIMLDHGTGIVIGETAAVGHNCSILHHVTLGGSGKKGVDRHPKVGNGVLLGAGASVLGNIHIGDGCQVGAGTLVIGDLPAHSVAVGVPAKIIGSFVDVSTQPSVGMNQLGSKESDASIVTFETEGI